MDHDTPHVATPATAGGDVARIRGVLAFAEDTGAPPEALAAVRGVDARDVTPAVLAPLLVGPGPGRG
jgi:hypothetical protein